MSKFLKLTHFIINTNHIHSIVKKPNKYLIQFMTNKLDGSTWHLWGSGFGSISSYNVEMEICETLHSSDYKIVTDWIDKQ